jgi:hypothetical protein
MATKRRTRTRTITPRRKGQKPLRFKQGTLRAQMGVKKGGKIGRARLQQAARSPNKLKAKRARFALNVLKAGQKGRRRGRR